jgi:hypothetical protein
MWISLKKRSIDTTPNTPRFQFTISLKKGAASSFLIYLSFSVSNKDDGLHLLVYTYHIFRLSLVLMSRVKMTIKLEPSSCWEQLGIHDCCFSYSI